MNNNFNFNQHKFGDGCLNILATIVELSIIATVVILIMYGVLK